MILGMIFLMIAVVAALVAFGGVISHPWDGTIIVFIIFATLAVATFIRAALQNRSIRK